jgi:6-phosphofructokinase 1
MVCEVMGRTAGWLAMYAGIAGGADVILLPEMDMTVEDAAAIIKKRHGQGRDSSLIVVGEGYHLRSSGGLFDNIEEHHELDAYGFPRLGGVSNHVARAVEQITGFETRVTILGHVQRGGTPTAYDRTLASAFGAYAAALVKQQQYGRMAAVQDGRLTSVALADAADRQRSVARDAPMLATALAVGTSLGVAGLDLRLDGRAPSAVMP